VPLYGVIKSHPYDLVTDYVISLQKGAMRSMRFYQFTIHLSLQNFYLTRYQHDALTN
jgi:hypothetical protein